MTTTTCLTSLWTTERERERAMISFRVLLLSSLPWLLLTRADQVWSHDDRSLPAKGFNSLTPNNCTYPALIEATADELQDGLQKGCFTSVDLVNVRLSSFLENSRSCWCCLLLVLLIQLRFTGVCGAHQGGQFYASYGVADQ